MPYPYPGLPCSPDRRAGNRIGRPSRDRGKVKAARKAARRH